MQIGQALARLLDQFDPSLKRSGGVMKIGLGGAVSVPWGDELWCAVCRVDGVADEGDDVWMVER